MRFKMFGDPLHCFYSAECLLASVFSGSQLLKELKKLDDKALLVEVQLNESKTYHALDNLPRSRYISE